jgi:hypothetical protein
MLTHHNPPKSPSPTRKPICRKHLTPLLDMRAWERHTAPDWRYGRSPGQHNASQHDPTSIRLDASAVSVDPRSTQLTTFKGATK